MTGAMQHTYIEWIQAEYPVQLIGGKGAEALGKVCILRKHFGTQICGCHHRTEPSVFPLPPGRCICIMWIEERCAPFAVFGLDILSTVAKGIINLSRNRQFK